VRSKAQVAQVKHLHSLQRMERDASFCRRVSLIGRIPDFEQLVNAPNEPKNIVNVCHLVCHAVNQTS